MHAVIQQHIPHSSQNLILRRFMAGQIALSYVGPRRVITQYHTSVCVEEQHARMDFTQERVTRIFLCINCIIIVYTKLA